MAGHSFIAPSFAPVWVHCAAAPMMAAMFPEMTESDDARAGTAAHWVGSDSLIEGKDPASYLGVVAPNGVVIDQDIIDSAAVYVDDVRANSSVPQLKVEQQLTMPEIHPDNWGTSDAFEHRGGEVWIWDFKHGHVAVEPFENWQLIDYAAGIIKEYGINGFQDQAITFVLNVVQPRAQHRDGPVRRWRVKACDLRGYFNRLSSAAHDVYGPNPKAKSGAHCVYCPGRLNCEAFTKAVGTVLDYISEPMPMLVTAEQIGTELVMLERAEQLLKARKAIALEQGERMASSGQIVPGWQLATKYGRLDWAAAPDVIAAMWPGTAKTDVITPTQAFKRKLVDEETAKTLGFVTTPVRGRELIRDDGTRARLAFKQDK